MTSSDKGPQRDSRREPDPDGDERKETATERADRNWDELLQELRVTQTGIQILSGFLLTLPFQQRFSALDGLLRAVFLIAVTLATVSTGLIVAPVAAHRLLFRKHHKIQLVEMSDKLAKAGLSCLGLTVVTVVALVFGFVLGETAGFLAAGAAFALFLTLWVWMPIAAVRRDRPDPAATAWAAPKAVDDA